LRFPAQHDALFPRAKAFRRAWARDGGIAFGFAHATPSVTFDLHPIRPGAKWQGGAYLSGGLSVNDQETMLTLARCAPQWLVLFAFMVVGCGRNAVRSDGAVDAVG
jgi:hypothetical protein